MNKETQDQFKKNIQIYQYDKNIIRFSFFGKEDVLGLPIQEKENYISLFKDPESKIQSKKKNFHFIYDPPTRNIRFDYENKTLFTGIVNTKDDRNFLNLFLYEDVNIFGLGAVDGNYTRNQGTFLLRNIDTYFYLLKNQPYASFPVIFFRKKNSNKHFAFIQYTSYPIEIYIHKNIHFPYKHELNFNYYFRRETEVIDFFILIGSAEEIIKNIIKLFGYPFFPPIWSLGYQQSRWSYKSQQKVLEIAKQARENHLPLDAIYLDIHYMDKYKVFTWNLKKFPEPAKMIEELNKLGIKLVTIVDPGIAIDSKYFVYNEGLKNQYFCKDADNNLYIGKVWPGKVHFPDFTRKDVQNWWSGLIEKWLSSGISGIWNDMNEPVLKIGTTDDPLKEKITHENNSHLKIRNIYANLQAESTFFGFKNKNIRPFILSRSGTIGLQKWASLWTGDNHTSWEHLRQNLYMVINLNLSGMFFTGADIGGFGAPRKGLLSIIKLIRDPELFERWNELGSMLPLFRNHTVLFSYEQEPWKFPKTTFYRVKKHINRRYQFLFYLYHLFYLAHTEGKPIIRPIFFEYSNLTEEDEKLKDQFFLGKDILVCPILYPKIKRYIVYLPPGNWYEFETGKLYNGNRWVEFSIDRGYYPLFIRGGSVVPIGLPKRNAEDTLQGEIFLEVYPDDQISGYLYLDDGITNNYKNQYFLAKIQGERKNNGDIMIQYEIINHTYIPNQKNIKLRLPETYKYLYYNKKKKNAIIRELLNEERKYAVSEFELPISENWETKITIYK